MCDVQGGACVCVCVNVHLCAALLIWLPLEQQDRLCVMYRGGRMCVCARV